MTDVSPTRSAVLELADERRAMQEGHAFLDEKCLLLAGEMMRELARHERLATALDAAWRAALAALAAAAARHGLGGLQVYPAEVASEDGLSVASRSLMGVRLQDASLALPPASKAPASERSPEAERCRTAFRALAEAAAPLAACDGNLERLHREYRRSVRRARALSDVLLPEADRTIAELETRLAELEQEDAVSMRMRA